MIPTGGTKPGLSANCPNSPMRSSKASSPTAVPKTPLDLKPISNPSSIPNSSASAAFCTPCQTTSPNRITLPQTSAYSKNSTSLLTSASSPANCPLPAHWRENAPMSNSSLTTAAFPILQITQLDPWRDLIAQLAALPNVACKISGVLAYCAPGNATLEAVRPYVEHCLESFGWHRVVWGSDWPVLQHAIRSQNMGANSARNRRPCRRGGARKTLSQKRGADLSEAITPLSTSIPPDRKEHS